MKNVLISSNEVQNVYCKFWVPSIHPCSTTYLESGHGGNSLTEDAQTSLAPLTSSKSWWDPEKFSSLSCGVSSRWDMHLPYISKSVPFKKSWTMLPSVTIFIFFYNCYGKTRNFRKVKHRWWADWNFENAPKNVSGCRRCQFQTKSKSILSKNLSGTFGTFFFLQFSVLKQNNEKCQTLEMEGYIR